MRRFLRVFRTLLRPRNLQTLLRVARSPRARDAAKAWRRGDSVAPLLPVGVPLLVWVYNRTYRKEQARKRASLAQTLRNEKRMYDQAEQRFLREIID